MTPWHTDAQRYSSPSVGVCPSVRLLNFTKEDKVNLSVLLPGTAQCGYNKLPFGGNRERHTGFGSEAEEAGSVQYKDNYSTWMGQGNSGGFNTAFFFFFFLLFSLAANLINELMVCPCLCYEWWIPGISLCIHICTYADKALFFIYIKKKSVRRCLVSGELYYSSHITSVEHRFNVSSSGYHNWFLLF